LLKKQKTEKISFEDIVQVTILRISLTTSLSLIIMNLQIWTEFWSKIFAREARTRAGTDWETIYFFNNLKQLNETSDNYKNIMRLIMNLILCKENKIIKETSEEEEGTFLHYSSRTHSKPSFISFSYIFLLHFCQGRLNFLSWFLILHWVLRFWSI